MGKLHFSLGLTLLLLLASVSAAPSLSPPTSPASKSLFIIPLRSNFCYVFCYPQTSLLSSEIVSGFLSNAVPAVTKLLWSLKPTTKTGIWIMDLSIAILILPFLIIFFIFSLFFFVLVTWDWNVEWWHLQRVLGRSR